MRLRWYVATAVALVTVAALVVGGVAVWHRMNQVHKVSVSAVVEKFRNGQPSDKRAVVAGPRPGVYVYATKGSEHVSAGNIGHTYPDKTTLTVTATGCGLALRWDALDERWMQWQLCRSPQGWRMRGYTDFHHFLYRSDRRDYACPAEPMMVSSGGASMIRCTTDGVTASTRVRVMGHRVLTIDGVRVHATHVGIALSAHGKSVSHGHADLWLSDKRSLPLLMKVVNHGSQEALGTHVRYDENVVLRLTSMKPLR